MKLPSIISQHHAIQVVAAFEAFKGVLVLVACSGILINHHDLANVAYRLVHLLHLNPAAHYPQLFIDFAANMQNWHLAVLAIAALLYAALRFAEAYGLFKEAAWAEVLAAVSGGVYIPFELVHMIHQPDMWSVGAFSTNLFVVALMCFSLYQRRRKQGPVA